MKMLKKNKKMWEKRGLGSKSTTWSAGVQVRKN